MTQTAILDIDPRNEHPAGPAALASIERWQTVRRKVRRLAIGHLRDSMTKWPEVFKRWQDQDSRGMELGSDDTNFHFMAGMAMRNILRQVVDDVLLPQVVQSDGEPASNWDDFYYGAVHALVQGRTE